jgi:ABC-type multidrug transport system ATPase subunit
LVLHNVTVTYPAAAPQCPAIVALDRVCLRAYEGEFALLSGPNGAGKSTLLDMLAGRIVPAAGHCTLDDGVRMPTDQIPMHLSVCTVFQAIERGIVPGLTVGDHLVFRRMSAERNRRNRSQLEREAKVFLGQHEFLVELQRRLQDPAVGLSGGWQQLLQLAGCVFARPDILLLDEPVSHLSHDMRTRAEEFLATAEPPRLTIYVAHEAPGPLIRRRASTEWRMVDGRIVT